MTIEDIDKELAGKGDFVQIDYMTRFLKEETNPEIKKYVSIKLSDVYQKRGMFSEAAKIYEMTGEFSKSYADQTRYYVIAAELYVKAEMYYPADECIRKALRETTVRQQNEIYKKMNDLYISQAEMYEKARRRNNAMKIYEKLLTMDISNEQKEDIKKKLLELYESLGKVREYYMLKGKMGKV